MGENRRQPSSGDKGQTETGRVITAAALIMILVFLSFLLVNNSLVIQEFGIGFSAAIVIDAFVVRTVLVPSVMHVLGPSNWWIPKWIDGYSPDVPHRGRGPGRVRGSPATGRLTAGNVTV